MSDYSLIIFDRENLPRGYWVREDSLANYFRGGGKALFIVPAFGSVATSIVTYTHSEGDFYYDFLKLDSNVTNGIVLQNNGFAGDLTSCDPLVPEYSTLSADTNKLAQSKIHIEGAIPMSGYLFPTPDAEPIYRYISSNPDTVNHQQVNGIAQKADEGQRHQVAVAQTH